MSARVIEIRDYHWFRQYVLNKVLDLGFRVFGGAVRNRIWRSINEDDRKKRFGQDYLLNMWDPEFDSGSWYNRKGDIADIDCIGTYEQFSALTSKEMELYGDLKYKVSKNSLRYPIPDLEIIEGELDLFTIKVTSKIRSSSRHMVEIDMFVCKSDKLKWLYKLLETNLDFACNGLCMQKVDGVLTTSMLYYGSFDRVMKISAEMARDEASLMREMISKSTYHRVAKMISYGWFTEVGCLHDYDADGDVTGGRNNLYLFARSSDTVPCILCSLQQVFYGTATYIRIDRSNCYHLSCYVEKSIECYEAASGKQFDRRDPFVNHRDITDPVVDELGNLVDPTVITYDPNESSSEVSDTASEPVFEQNPDDSDSEQEPDPVIESVVQTTENRVIPEGFTQDEIDSLDRFRVFTRNQAQVLDDVTPEVHDYFHIVGNTVFENGIARNTTDEEIAYLREQIASGRVDDEDEYDEYDEGNNRMDPEAARRSGEYFSLCFSPFQVALLTELYQFNCYIKERYVAALRQ